jgi:ADP-ribose pyrophosphatase YjhB (NUDIX family)
VARSEFFQDPAAPTARQVTPSAFALVRDAGDRLLLVRRLDSGNWELPGGQVEVGDTATGALHREVAEEAGVTIDVLGIAGVHSDPGYVIRSAAGEVRQPFVVTYHAILTPDSPAPRPGRDQRSGVDRPGRPRRRPDTSGDAPLDRRRPAPARRPPAL